MDVEINIGQEDDSGYNGQGRPGLYSQETYERQYKLLCAIEDCLEAWGDDPTYNKATQKLREVCRELEYLRASPGHRAALQPNHAGQEPSYKQEYS